MLWEKELEMDFLVEHYHISQDMINLQVQEVSFKIHSIQDYYQLNFSFTQWQVEKD